MSKHPDYAPIEEHGVIGNCQTTGLVDMDGHMTWFCYPHFDSPSVFGAILDSKIGGRWSVDIVGDQLRRKQFYWPETNVLVTRYFTEHGVGQVVDYMPMPNMSRTQRPHGMPDENPLVVIRRLEVVRGAIDFSVLIQPAFDYARQEHRTYIAEQPGAPSHLAPGGVEFHCDEAHLSMAVASVPVANFVAVDGHPLGKGARCTVSMNENSPPQVFVLGECYRHHGGLTPPDPRADFDIEPRIVDLGELASHEKGIFERTIGFWRRWISQCTYQGRWREMVIRSCLVLKLLTFSPTGAIIAAATTSLPEGIGGERQWDYRYTWVRDSSFVLYALLKVGFVSEATRYMRFIEHRLDNIDGELERLKARAAAGGEDHQSPMPIQIMYTIDGCADLEEFELPHLDGYRGSKPVRIGNGAAKQLQLDIFGELMDSIYLIDRWAEPISYALWCRLQKLLDWLCENWEQKDEGIWEVRGGRQDFVYSRVMCWVALDRGLRLADRRSFPAKRAKWLKVRDRIYEEIMERGWNAHLQAFTQSYEGEGAHTLDAANLMMPLVLFVAPNDPRWESTIEAILRPPNEGGLCENSLVFRYDTKTGHDGLHGNEGTFNICTFWLVEALARAGRRDQAKLEKSQLMFEEMLGYANHLGLYAEETGPSGEALGNFPQAFTHLALISAAINIDRGLNMGSVQPM